MSKIIGDTVCPVCREQGGDSTGNHLMIFEDGGKFCNRCGCTENATIINQEEEELDVHWTKYTPQQVKTTLPYGAIPERKLSEEAIKHFGLRVEYDTSTGEVDKVFYPYFDGKDLGYKLRKHFEEGDREVKNKPELIGKFKCFRAVGNVKGSLFNQHKVPRGSKKVLLVEGEEDAPAAYEMLKKYNPKVLSIPSGASLDKNGKGILDKAIIENLDYLQSHKELVVCFDQDKAGKAITEELSRLIGPSVKVMHISKKDASDALTKGGAEEFVSAYFSAKTYTPVGIIEGGIGLDELLTPIKKGVKVDVLPGTMEKMQGLRDGELTLILAPAGIGKTTISKEIGYALNKAGEKIVHVFLEEDLKKTQQSYIAIDNNVHLAKLRKDPSIISREAAQKSYDELIEHQLYLDHWGSMSPAEVMENFRYGASWGATKGILDHISMVFSGTETNNERKDIDLLLTNMAAFTRESGMHLIIISHIKRANRPFRKSDAYPYWETVASDAGRGSGAFEQLADNIITLEVEYLDEDLNKGRIRTRVAKNREWSVLGVGDVLTYSLETGRISPEKQLTISGDY